MKRTPRVFVVLAMVCLATLLAMPTVARGQKASLGSCVPDNVHVYGSWQHNPERAALMEPFAGALLRLVDSGIGWDFFDLATHELSSSQREEAVATVRKVLDLLKTVNWPELTKGDGAVAYRLTFPIPELLVLFRVEEDTVAKRRDEFHELLNGVAQFAPDALAVDSEERAGAKLLTLRAQAPLHLTVATARDVVLIGLSSTLLDNSLDLVNSPDAAGSVAKDERFLGGRSGLPAAEDSEFYLDLKGYLNFFSGLFEMAAANFGEGEDAESGIAIVRNVFRELKLMNSVAFTERTDGSKLLADSKLAFEKSRDPGFIETLIRDQKPLRDYTRVVPRDAESFYITSGINWERVYDAVLEAVGKFAAGDALLERWNELQTRAGFHLREDLLSWIDGGGGWITLPRSGGGSDCVCFVRVKDDEKARKSVLGALRKAQEFLQGRGQKLEIVRTEPDGDFREIRLGALPSFRPVIGVPSGVLIVASSREAVDRVRATFAGEAPSIHENPRFAAIGVPGGDLRSVYYRDAENSLKGIADLMGIAGLIASIMPREDDLRPVLKLGAIFTKLAVFLREVDLATDQGGWERYDAEARAVFGHAATVLKEPPKKKRDL